MIRSLLSQRWPEWVVWVAAGLILLGGVALSVLARELIQWWGVLVLAGIAALFWWQRRPLTRASDGDSEQAHQRRIAWLVLGVSLAFQVVRWIGEEGALRSKAGDDDEAYVFLAYQLLGLFGGAPVFALRPPGWPGIVAGLLALFGREAVWSVGLFHRMLLVAFPPLLYLILARYVRPPVAGAAALLSLAMEYNEAIAASAFSDLSYTAAGFFCLFGLWKTLTGEHRARWLIFAALMAALKSMIRLSGAAVVIASALALLLALPDRWPRRVALGGAFLAPTVAAILGLGLYNQSLTGQFGLSTVGSFTLLYHYGPFLSTAPDTPATREFASLLPEVPPDYLFRTPRDLWVAQYRYTARGGGIFDYGELVDRAAQDVVRHRTGEYLTRMGKALGITLADPWRDLVPTGWLAFPLVLPYDTGTLEDAPACNMQYSFGARVDARVCEDYARFYPHIEFQSRWVQAIPAPIRRLDHLLAVSLPYRVRFLIWPLYWGIAAFAGMAYLLTQSTTRRLAILLGLPLLAELAVLLVATNGLETRYLFYLHPTYLIFTWLSLSLLLDRLRGRANRLEG